MEKETYLTFVLGRELFAVNVKNVLEVLEQQPITRVPKAPDQILGIINFRGEILPVVNTHLKFGFTDTETSAKPYVIVYDLARDGHRYFVAATADGVKDVIEVLPDEVKPVPEMGINYDARFLEGAIIRHDRFVLMVHPDKLFSAADTEITTESINNNN
jgi:purine-binding chemotaxis protein CheW